MANQAVSSDKGVGIAMVLSVLALLGAATMVVGPTQTTMAWGFAAAMVAGALAVVSLHAFD
jgi:hypothetical protein